MNAAEEARFEPGEVIVSGTAGTIVDKATQGGTTVSFFHHEGDGEVSEASSKLTHLAATAAPELKLFQTFSSESHAQSQAMYLHAVSLF